MTSISIPSSVRSIGEGAFAESSLKNVHIPDDSQLQVVGDYCFSGTQVTEEAFSKHKIKIGDGAFAKIS
jgi:hypothetical protein